MTRDDGNPLAIAANSNQPPMARVGKYLMLDLLGEGAFGKVRLSVDESDGRQYAMKIMDKSNIKANDLTLQVRREIAVMKAMRHPNIVNLHEVLTSSKNLYMVMDLVTGGELFDAVAEAGRLPEARSRLYFQQLIDGISYCHNRRVYHRDLKPENLLLSGDKRTIKITDFGLSSIKAENTTSELLHTIMGSPHYIAPEIITSAAKGYDGAKVDIWASGVILFGMLAGYLPFDEANTRELYSAIVHKPVNYPKHFSYDAIKLIRALLNKDPQKRPATEEIKSFNWFKVNYVPAQEPEQDRPANSLQRKKTKGRMKKQSEKTGKNKKNDQTEKLPATRGGYDKDNDFGYEDVDPRPIHTRPEVVETPRKVRSRGLRLRPHSNKNTTKSYDQLQEATPLGMYSTNDRIARAFFQRRANQHNAAPVSQVSDEVGDPSSSDIPTSTGSKRSDPPSNSDLPRLNDSKRSSSSSAGNTSLSDSSSHTPSNSSSAPCSLDQREVEGDPGLPTVVMECEYQMPNTRSSFSKAITYVETPMANQQSPSAFRAESVPASGPRVSFTDVAQPSTNVRQEASGIAEEQPHSRHHTSKLSFQDDTAITVDFSQSNTCDTSESLETASPCSEKGSPSNTVSEITHLVERECGSFDNLFQSGPTGDQDDLDNLLQSEPTGDQECANDAQDIGQQAPPEPLPLRKESVTGLEIFDFTTPTKVPEARKTVPLLRTPPEDPTPVMIQSEAAAHTPEPEVWDVNEKEISEETFISPVSETTEGSFSTPSRKPSRVEGNKVSFQPDVVADEPLSPELCSEKAETSDEASSPETSPDRTNSFHQSETAASKSQDASAGEASKIFKPVNSLFRPLAETHQWWEKASEDHGGGSKHVTRNQISGEWSFDHGDAYADADSVSVGDGRSLEKVNNINAERGQKGESFSSAWLLESLRKRITGVFPVSTGWADTTSPGEDEESKVQEPEARPIFAEINKDLALKLTNSMEYEEFSAKTPRRPYNAFCRGFTREA